MSFANLISSANFGHDENNKRKNVRGVCSWRRERALGLSVHIVIFSLAIRAVLQISQPQLK